MSKSIVVKNGLVSYLNKEDNPILFLLPYLYGIGDITIVIFYILVLALYILKIYMSDRTMLKNGLVSYINKENNQILFSIYIL